MDNILVSPQALQAVVGFRPSRSAPQRRAETLHSSRRKALVSGKPAPHKRPEHILITGPTGCGKDKLLEFLFFGDDLRRPDRPAIVDIDLHGGTVETGAIKAHQYGLLETGQAVIDRIRETRHAPGYDILQPSDNPDPEQRYAENRAMVQDIQAMVMRDRGQLDATPNPAIDEASNDLFSLALFRRREHALQFDWLDHGFRFEKKTHHYIVNTCERDKTREKFNDYADLKKRSLRDFQINCVSVQRIISKRTDCIQFVKRCGRTTDWAAFLNKGNLLFVSGESKGNIGRQDATRIAEMILRKIMNLARMGKFNRRVIVCINEGVGAGLLDAMFIRDLAEARKWNIQFVILVPDVFMLDETVRHAVLELCKTKYVGYQPNPASARLFAEMIEVPQMNLHTVKSTDYTTRRVTVGYDQIGTRGKSVSKDPLGGKRITETEGTHFIPIQHDVQEAHDKTYTHEEKIVLRQQKLMKPATGWFHVISLSYISTDPEYFPLLPMPYEGLMYQGIPLNQYMMEQALCKQYETNPVYHAQLAECPEWTATPSVASGTTEPSSGLKNGFRRQRGNSSNGRYTRTVKKPGKGSTS